MPVERDRASGRARDLTAPAALTLLRFDDAQPIAYLENLGGASVTRRRADVALYEEAFNDLQILAVGPEESLGMIREAIKEH
ncbi:Scr1 family TA system antitoxin-like transcriptional regulator [Streptomyces sp. NPDC056323]|uniref:Scr1 family TA system antitoxin-like transcriptional regulator n=1 Tax=unclassified Streptomyces TaxID=2593676 RepID=UPI0035E2B843